jgi:hypothetical protein
LDEDDKLDSVICELAYFYKGAASFEWLESQTIPKLLHLHEEALKINEQMKPKEE